LLRFARVFSLILFNPFVLTETYEDDFYDFLGRPISRLVPLTNESEDFFTEDDSFEGEYPDPSHEDDKMIFRDDAIRSLPPLILSKKFTAYLEIYLGIFGIHKNVLNRARRAVFKRKEEMSTFEKRALYFCRHENKLYIYSEICFYILSALKNGQISFTPEEIFEFVRNKKGKFGLKEKDFIEAFISILSLNGDLKSKEDIKGPDFIEDQDSFCINDDFLNGMKSKIFLISTDLDLVRRVYTLKAFASLLPAFDRFPGLKPQLPPLSDILKYYLCAYLDKKSAGERISPGDFYSYLIVNFNVDIYDYFPEDVFEREFKGIWKFVLIFAVRTNCIQSYTFEDSEVFEIPILEQLEGDTTL
jgi:hypothetical protein